MKGTPAKSDDRRCGARLAVQMLSEVGETKLKDQGSISLKKRRS